MNVQEALQTAGWQWMEIRGIAYNVEKFLANSGNEEVLQREAEIRTIEASQPWEETEEFIAVPRGGLHIAEIPMMLNECSSGTSHNGLFLG